MSNLAVFSAFSGPYGGYILAAYALTALVLGGMILATFWRYRASQQGLRTLEQVLVQQKTASLRAGESSAPAIAPHPVHGEGA